MPSYPFLADIVKFNPHTTRYYGENALVLADCAKLAYQPEPEIKAVIQGSWQFKNFEFFNAKSTQAFIAGNDEIIIVAFRGTEITKIADILADAQVKLIPGPAGKVHKGFYSALQQVWGDSASKDMRQYIKKFQDNNQSVWFCGHSLGAALACLATAEYVMREKGTINGLYTIGQPRVGNAAFAKAFDDLLIRKSFRFINNNDVVTHIPAPGVILNYTHTGNVLYIDTKGNLNDSISWWKKSVDMLNGALKDIKKLGPDNIKDHSSDNYVSLIEKNRAVTTQWS